MKEELMELRQKMKEYGMAAYLIVSDDFHASEYVGEYFKCREYISGFNGSAGTLVITLDRRKIFYPGRRTACRHRYYIIPEWTAGGSGYWHFSGRKNGRWHRIGV